MSLFIKIKGLFSGEYKRQKKILLGYEKYEDIKNADTSIKTKIASNYLNFSVDSGLFDLDSLIKDNIEYYRILFRIHTIAIAMFIAENNKYDISVEFWHNIKLNNVIDGVIFNKVAISLKNLLTMDNGWKCYYQYAAFSCPSEKNEYNVNKSLESLNIILDSALKDAKIRNQMWLPSASYVLITNELQRDALTFAWGLLGFSHGNKEWVNEHKYQNELRNLEIEQMKNDIKK